MSEILLIHLAKVRQVLGLRVESASISELTEDLQSGLMSYHTGLQEVDAVAEMNVEIIKNGSTHSS